MDPDAGPVQRFAHELRLLRQKAGSPSYREMSQHTGVSVTTLSRAAAGERLPSAAVTRAYARACDADPGEWEARWKEAAEEAAGVQAAARDGAGTAEDDAKSPYRGLARFEPGDRELFFGRDRPVAELLELVREHQFAAVFGASGSGKSSLLRAGLIPAVQEAAQSLGRRTALRILTPGERPAATYGPLLAPKDGDPDTWLIIDQFEEVFTPLPGPGRAHPLHRPAAQIQGSGLPAVYGDRDARRLLRAVRRAPGTHRRAAALRPPGGADEPGGAAGDGHRPCHRGRTRGRTRADLASRRGGRRPARRAPDALACAAGDLASPPRPHPHPRRVRGGGRRPRRDRGHRGTRVRHVDARPGGRRPPSAAAVDRAGRGHSRHPPLGHPHGTGRVVRPRTAGGRRAAGRRSAAHPRRRHRGTRPRGAHHQLAAAEPMDRRGPRPAGRPPQAGRGRPRLAGTGPRPGGPVPGCTAGARRGTLRAGRAVPGRATAV